MRFLKITAIALSCLSAYLAIEQLIDLQTKGFCLQKILAEDLPPQPQWEILPLSPTEFNDIRTTLQQPFFLIDSGSECFVFLSQDKKTILKCFKLSFARPVYYRKGLFTGEYTHFAGMLSPPPRKPWITPFETLRQRICGIREFRLLRTFGSCKLAYEHLREETGVFYIHLNPTDAFVESLTLIDGNGIAYALPINSTKFILQKKATLLETHFQTLLDNQQTDAIAASIDSLVDLVERRCQKGFADRDFINRNIGYIGNQAIEIDLGSFTRDDTMTKPDILRKELRLSTKQFKKWLKKNAPEWIPYLNEKIAP